MVSCPSFVLSLTCRNNDSLVLTRKASSRNSPVNNRSLHVSYGALGGNKSRTTTGVGQRRRLVYRLTHRVCLQFWFKLSSPKGRNLSMVLRKDAIPLLVCLLVGALVGPGCMGLTGSEPEKPVVRGTDLGGRAPQLADATFAPDLRIPQRTNEPSTPGRGAQEFQLVSATEIQPVILTDRATSTESETNATAKLRMLYQQALEHYNSMDSYIVRFRRREQINGKDKPEEVIYARFRKNPWSVYFKWLGQEAKGREVVFVKGQYDEKIHTLLAAGDMPLMPAGKRFAVSPDSPLVMASSRHSIRESGVGPLIDHFGRMVAAVERRETQPGAVRYLGRLKRPEFDDPCEGVEQRVASGTEATLPRGGTRLWLFDLASKLPTLVIARDETGHEVEYYCYDRFECPVRLDDADFNPDKLWKDRR